MRHFQNKDKLTILVIVLFLAGSFAIVKNHASLDNSSTTARVIAQRPQIKSFLTYKNNIPPDQGTYLRWNVEGANYVTINPGIGKQTNNGLAYVKPGKTTIYTITAENSYGKSSSTTKLLVNGIQTLQLINGPKGVMYPDTELKMDMDCGKIPPGTPQRYGILGMGDYKIDALLSGYRWPTNQITYSFYEDDVFKGTYYGSELGVKEVSEAVKNNTRSIMAWYATLMNLNIVEVQETSNNIGQIRIMDSNDPGYAYAYYPSTTTMFHVAGDVHLNSNYDRLIDTNGFQNPPGYHGYSAIVHELGHALGLKHPHTGSPVLPSNEDTDTNTIMSYQFIGNSPSTPMAYDISALHYLYGAKSLRAGNEIYTYTRDDLDQYSVYGITYLNPPTSPTKHSIWDSGGYNTLDFSGVGYAGANYRIDTNPFGYISNAADYATSYIVKGTTIGPNVSISKIINSQGNDIIYANPGWNTFAGYGPTKETGDDIIYNASTSDQIDLSNYLQSMVTQTYSGNDLILTLGSNGTITLKDYNLGFRPNIIFQSASLSLMISDSSVKEGNSSSTNMTFLISLSSPTNKSVSVNYNTVNVEATAGVDYQATSGTITFTAGESAKSIQVPVYGDTTIELNETFQMILSNPQGGITISDDIGIGTIINDDVALNIVPVISITADRLSGTIPLNIIFSSNGTYDPDGSISRYDWTFGDGSTSSLSNPVYTYVNPGNFTARLIVTDNSAASSNKSLNITANQGSPPNISYFTSTPNIIINGTTSTLSWSTTNATTVVIDNGIGMVGLLGTTQVNPQRNTTYVLNATNYYGSTIKETNVSVNPACNKYPPTIILNPNVQTGYAGEAKIFSVNIKNNDATACSNSNITLTSQMGIGLIQLPANQVILLAPSANSTINISINTSKDLLPSNYGFSETASSTIGSTTAYGTLTIIKSPCIRANPGILISPYSTSGLSGETRSYLINITNNDGPNCDASNFSIVSYLDPGFNQSPAKFNASINFGSDYSRIINITSSRSVTPGTYLIQENIIHLIYPENSNAGTAYYVISPNQLPIASISTDKYSGSIPLTIRFSGNNSYDPDGTIISYDWSFGDGGNSTEQNPYHTYVDEGSFTANLTVTDNYGAKTSNAAIIYAINTSPPAINYFKITPTQILSGQSALLHWSVDNSASVIITPDIGNVPSIGTINVNPTINTTYLINATNQYNSTMQTIAIIVNQPTIINSFNANPSTIIEGQTTTITWATSYADTVLIDNNIGLVNAIGSLNISPSASKNYKLTASNNYSNATSTVYVVVNKIAKVNSFTANPTAIIKGQECTLSWSTSDATTITIDPEIGSVLASGSITIKPNNTKSYSITASNQYGSNTQSLNIVVNNPPKIVSFTANPTSIISGDSLNLTWEASEADSVLISPNIGIVSNIGSITISPKTTTTYAITASSAYGTDNKNITVIVNHLPSIDLLSFNPEMIIVGQETILNWNVSNATSIVIDPDIGRVALIGNLTLRPNTTTTYTMTAVNEYGSVNKTVSVVVNQPPIIESFSLSPDYVLAGQTTEFTWSTSAAKVVSILPEIGIVNLSGSINITGQNNTEYTLTAQNDYGTVNKSITLKVQPIIKIKEFLATPQKIMLGKQANLTWSVDNADTIIIDNGIGEVSSEGTQTINPNTTTTYLLMASNPLMSLTTNVEVLVIPSGDANEDSEVNIADILFVAQDLGKTSGYSVMSDQNSDGTINILDIISIVMKLKK